MPDPKVLGIIGGVIAVGLLIAGFATGIISVPGFAPDAKTVVQQFTEEYNKLGGKNISESDWKELQQRTREAVVAVNRSMMGSQMSAEDMKLRFAITKLGAFVSAKFDDEEARSKAFEDVKAALSQL